MPGNDKLTEEKIFDSATEIFLSKGMDGARMRDIASHAGINKSLLNYYYRSKDKLFEAVFEKVAGEVFKKFAPVFDRNLTLEQKIRFFYNEHISFLQQNPRLPAFLINEVNRHPERIRKLVMNLDPGIIWEMLQEQHKEELPDYNITRENLPQLMTSIASLSVFPFAAKALFSGILEKMGFDFKIYLEERKEYAADFVIAAIKKKRKKEKGKTKDKREKTKGKRKKLKGKREDDRLQTSDSRLQTPDSRPQAPDSRQNHPI